MSLYLLENKEKYCYGIWKSDEDELTLQNLSGCTAPSRITNSCRRIEYLAVRSLVKAMGVEPENILYMETGKPFLDNNNLNISISHTKGYVSVLLSPNQYTAIDIETRSERILKVRKKYMHIQEEKALMNSGVDEITSLLLHWCAKEAIFKAIPYEGIDFVKEIRVNNFYISGNTGSFNVDSLRDGRVFTVEYLVEKDFILTACYSDSSCTFQ
jgi:4'-phosphopantetheinyl transferase